VQLYRRVGGTWNGHRLILFGFLSQSSKRKTVAVVVSVPHSGMTAQDMAVSRRGDLIRFRAVFYACVTARADELFELTEALLCTEGPVRTLVELALAPEHRRGHGALYDWINHGMTGSTTVGSRWRGCGGSWPSCRCPVPGMGGSCWGWT